MNVNNGYFHVFIPYLFLERICEFISKIDLIYLSQWLMNNAMKYAFYSLEYYRCIVLRIILHKTFILIFTRHHHYYYYRLRDDLLGNEVCGIVGILGLYYIPQFNKRCSLVFLKTTM